MAWCTKKGIPEIIIRNLVRTRDLHLAKLYAFCILPTHLHLLISPCGKGLSKYVQSFKSNCTKDVVEFLTRSSDAASHSSDAASHSSDAASLLRDRYASLLRDPYASLAFRDRYDRDSSWNRNSDAASLAFMESEASLAFRDRYERDSYHRDPASWNRNSDAASLAFRDRIYWQKGYWDERIQSSRQYSAAMWYIQGNATKHRIVKEMIDWPWSSLHFQELLDVPEIFMD